MGRARCASARVWVGGIPSMRNIPSMRTYTRWTSLLCVHPPSEHRQSSLLMSALLLAGLEPAQITGIQMHANGESTPCSFTPAHQTDVSILSEPSNYILGVLLRTLLLTHPTLHPRHQPRSHPTLLTPQAPPSGTPSRLEPHLRCTSPLQSKGRRVRRRRHSDRRLFGPPSRASEAIRRRPQV